LSVTQRWSFCCPIPWWRNIWQRISVRLRPWMAFDKKWRANGKIHNYQNIRWMCFGFSFTVVRYRGHILAEWENRFVIADFVGTRRGGQDFFSPLYVCKDESRTESDRLQGLGSWIEPFSQIRDLRRL
jgi:hypothetical protein